MRSFCESVFLFTTQCSSPSEPFGSNALFLWEHSLCAPEGAERQWAARGENSRNGRTYTWRDPKNELLPSTSTHKKQLFSVHSTVLLDLSPTLMSQIRITQLHTYLKNSWNLCFSHIKCWVFYYQYAISFVPFLFFVCISYFVTLSHKSRWINLPEYIYIR